MTRYHTKADENGETIHVPYTPQEEIDRDAEVAEATANVSLSKWEEIKTFRKNRLENGGFECVDHWYHSDPASKTEFLGLKLKALENIISGGDMNANIQIDGTDTMVKTIDNGYMTVTFNKALEIVAAAEVQTKKTYAAAATHQYFLNLSADPANYDFSAGWPPIYGE